LNEISILTVYVCMYVRTCWSSLGLLVNVAGFRRAGSGLEIACRAFRTCRAGAATEKPLKTLGFTIMQCFRNFFALPYMEGTELRLCSRVKYWFLRHIPLTLGGGWCTEIFSWAFLL